MTTNMQKRRTALLILIASLCSSVSCESIEDILYQALNVADDTELATDRLFGWTPRGSRVDGALIVTPSGEKLVEMDMAYTDEEIEKMYPSGASGRKKRAALPEGSSQWTNGDVPYVISGPFFHLPSSLICISPSSEENIIREAMAAWEKTTCIRFVPRTTQSSYIDYRSDKNGCWSYVGMVSIQPQTINLNRAGCVTKRIAQHEIGHALGLHHEQTRGDRDNYLTIIWENIPEDKWGNFAKRTYLDSRGLPYDFQSVMHYGKTAWGYPTGAVTIQTKDPAFTDVIGSAKQRSHLDSYVINLMYGCAAGCNIDCDEADAFVSETSDGCVCLCPADDGFDSTPCVGNRASDCTDSGSACKWLSGLCIFPFMWSKCSKTCDKCVKFQNN